MGPLRRGLSTAAALALAPSAAWAQVCDQVRPFWTPGSPATAWDELLGLMGTIPSLVLLVLSLVVIRFRHAWGALVVTVLWTLWISVVAFLGPRGATQQQAAAEGCIGSPSLFIAAAAALCIGMILWAGRPGDRL